MWEEQGSAWGEGTHSHFPEQAVGPQRWAFLADWEGSLLPLVIHPEQMTRPACSS